MRERRDLLPADETLSAARRPDRVLPKETDELVGELVLLCMLEYADDPLDRLDLCVAGLPFGVRHIHSTSVLPLVNVRSTDSM